MIGSLFMHKLTNCLSFMEVLNVVCFLPERAKKLHNFSLNILNIFVGYAPEPHNRWTVSTSHESNNSNISTV